jgi:hypothetical protein
LAEEVASGDAFQKHVVERQEFAGLGISTKSQFQSFVENIVSNPAMERRQAVDGTVYYLDSSTKTIIIRGQRGEATTFRPDKGGVGWENYIKSQVPKMTEINNGLESIHLEVTHRELRYFISCSLALVQNVPEDSLPTYCGLSKDEIMEVSLRLRGIADQLGVDM